MIQTFAKLGCNLCMLKHLLPHLGLSFDESVKLSELHCILTGYTRSSPFHLQVVKYIEQGFALCDTWADFNKVQSSWPAVHSSSVNWLLVDNFLVETSSAALKSSVCASCSQNVLDHDMPSTSLDISLLTHTLIISRM